jgi:flagellar protein FlaJ
LNLSDLITKSGEDVSPSSVSKSTRRRLKRALLGAAPATYLAFRITHQPLMLLILPVALTLAYAVAPITLLSKASNRRRQVETELPFASTLLTVAANHAPPLTTLRNALNTPSLKQTSKEYLKIVKHTKLNHLTPAQAANQLANQHPSQRFQAFLRTVSAAERGVGDPYYSLRDHSKAELANLSHDTELATERLGVASSTVLIAFAVLPLTMLIFASITAQPLLIYLATFTALPAAALVNIIIEQAYPATLRPVSLTPTKKTIVSASLITVLSAFAPLPLYLRVAIALFAATAPIAAYYHSQSKHHSKLLAALPQLARDFAEEAKKGAPPTAALTKIAASNKYSAQLLERIVSPNQPKPYLAQAYSDLLAESEKLGADTEQLESLADTVNAVASTQNSYNSKASFFRATVYVSAAILAAAASAVTDTLKTLAQKSATGFAPSSVLFIHFNPGLQTSVYTSIILNAYLLGLLAGKAHKGSALYGLTDALLTTTIAVATILLGRLI